MKDDFISQWKELEDICEKIFKPVTGVPTDEIFTRYMYYKRAESGNKNSTVEALRKFYEPGNYSLLTENYEATLSDLMTLAKFWQNVSYRNTEIFSKRVLQRLCVLSSAPNSMWTYITSVYFMHNKLDNNTLDDERFYKFLNTITAFIWEYTIIRPGIGSLRTPLFDEMVNIVQDKDTSFCDYRINSRELRNMLYSYSFNGKRPITKSMLVWWAFTNPDQVILPRGTTLEIEHIYAKNRTHNPENIEALGNKSVLEKNINIRASDYKFSDKAKYLSWPRFRKPSTQIHELAAMAKEMQDFTAHDIDHRNTQILEAFLNFVAENNLLR